MTTVEETVRDGRIQCYVPDKKFLHGLRSEDHLNGLAMHRDALEDGELSPIEFEIIRYQLWSINEEHGETIAKISGSPITKYTMDFNPSLLTEDGEIIYFGPYVQWFSGMSDVVVEWILENRSLNPGIRDGDMFLTNDPWVGTTHQQDVGLFCPVFVDGRLFAWVSNAVHQYDVGGIAAGSFVPQARDVFDEAVPLPPVKIVEGDEIRLDIEELYLRHSRLPKLVRLDLHAAITGNRSAKARLLELVEKYGAAKVKAAMRRILNNGEKAFRRKLEMIPDGTWRDRIYLDVAKEGDRDLYRVVLDLRKEGDRLIFDNKNTEEQTGVLNASFAAWRGGILTVLNAFMCYDQLWSIGGASRCIDFDPTPGLLSCADYPASMSCGGTIGAYAAIVLANNCLAKMMACSGNADLQMDIMANEANSMWPITQLSGIDRRGERYGSAILDPMIGGLGAFTFRDGIDTGGMYLVPKGKAANVEQNELHFPVLYLYRKELMDSGGVGEYRGGNSGELAFIPHKTEHITQDTATSGAAVPTGMGLFGGGPGCTNEYLMIYESDIRRRFEKGDCVNSWEELVGNVQVLPPKKAGIEQRADDVYVIHWSAGAGIGDPLLRPIDKVEEDVKQGHISIACAQSQYGVVFEQRGAYLKRVSNEEERKRLLESRLAQATLPALTNNRKVDVGRCVRVYRSLAIEKSKSIWVCGECGEVLGSLVAGYKAGCAILESKLSDIQPLVKDPRIMVDRSLVARQFLCPSCGVRIEIELVREGDQQIYDMEIVGS